MENKNENIQALSEEEMENAAGGIKIPMEDLLPTYSCPKCGFKIHDLCFEKCPACGTRLEGDFG